MKYACISGIFLEREVNIMNSILAMFYLLGLKIKETLYNLGILSLKTLQCKVISVGNLTVRGKIPGAET